MKVGESNKVIDGSIGIITNLESGWRNVENDSKLNFGKLSKSENDLRNRSTILRPELTFSIRKKLEHDLAKSEHNFAQNHKNKMYFYGLDFVPIYEGCFYYKYKPCIK